MAVPSSALSSASSDTKANGHASSRFQWPFSLRSSGRIEEFRLPDVDKESDAPSNVSNTTTATGFRLAWPLSWQRIRELDEFRLPEAGESLPSPSGERLYKLVWPFSTVNCSNMDEFRLPQADTETSAAEVQPVKHTEEPLREAILREMKRSKLDRKDFLPEKALKELFSRPSIRACIPSATETLVDYVEMHGRRVFATVLMSTDFEGRQLVSLLEFFRQRGFGDADLPIARHHFPESTKQEQREGGKPSQLLPPWWTASMIQRFYNSQWAFVVPVFREGTDTKLHADDILPFTSLDNVVQEGAFSTVYQATMPAEYQDVMGDVSTPGLNEVRVAIKVLKNVADDHGHETMKDVASAWRREKQALERIRTLGELNVLPLIASFERDDQYFFIFPWADGGNLRNFWDSNPNIHLHLSTQIVQDYLEQLLGLTNALRSLHDAGERHGDLKPGNILLRKEGSWLGILQIADFGLAKKHEIVTELRGQHTEEQYGTRMYEPPEVMINHPGRARSRLYDVWSMGCIIFESLVWLSHGKEGLESFYSAANVSSHADYAHPPLYGETPYFTFDRKGGVSLSEGLLRWAELISVRFSPAGALGGTALADTLNLVMTKLLVIALPKSEWHRTSLQQTQQHSKSSPPTLPLVQLMDEMSEGPEVTSTSATPARADAKVLCKELGHILAQARADPEYCLAGKDRSGPSGSVQGIAASSSPSQPSVQHQNPQGMNLANRFHKNNRFAQLALLIVRILRLKRKVIANRHDAKQPQDTETALPKSVHINEPRSNTPIQSHRRPTDESSSASKHLDDPHSAPTAASPPQPVSDQVLSSLFHNKTPAEIALMLSNKSASDITALFSNANPDISQDAIEMSTSDLSPTSPGNFASNTSRKSNTAGKNFALIKSNTSERGSRRNTRSKRRSRRSNRL